MGEINVLKSRPKRLWIAASVIVVFLLGFISCSVISNANKGTVVSVIDGNTLIISMHETEKTVRLLNVYTPSLSEPAECLGTKARDFLGNALPAGTEVRVEFEAGHKDDEGNNFAAVFTKPDTLVNAEIARHGFGTALSEGPNEKYLAQISAAQEEAKVNERGLFGIGDSCTLPSQILFASQDLGKIASLTDPRTSEEAGTSIAAAAEVIASAKSLETLLKEANKTENAILWAAYTPTELATKIAVLSKSIAASQTKTASLTTTKNKLAEAEAKAAAAKIAAAKKAAAEKAAAAEAKKLAREAAERAKAEAAAAAEAERIRNLPAPYVPPVQQAPANPYPGYTGRRCYAPGGKSYRPC